MTRRAGSYGLDHPAVPSFPLSRGSERLRASPAQYRARGRPRERKQIIHTPATVSAFVLICRAGCSKFPGSAVARLDIIGALGSIILWLAQTGDHFGPRRIGSLPDCTVYAQK